MSGFPIIPDYIDSNWTNDFGYYFKIVVHGREFAEEHNLPQDYSWWPEDMKMLFKLTYG